MGNVIIRRKDSYLERKEQSHLYYKNKGFTYISIEGHTETLFRKYVSIVLCTAELVGFKPLSLCYDGNLLLEHTKMKIAIDFVTKKGHEV